MFDENESVTGTNYKIAHNIEARRNRYTEENFIKKCMMEAENDLCSENAALLGIISLSASYVVRRTWRDRNLWWYSLALVDSVQDVIFNSAYMTWCIHFHRRTLAFVRCHVILMMIIT